MNQYLIVSGMLFLGFFAFLVVAYTFALIYQYYNNSHGGTFKINSKIYEFYLGFKTLSRAPRELWIIYILKFLESYGYFSSSLILTLFLSKEYGYDDAEAGLMYGIFGTAISVVGLFIGIYFFL
eukprot:c21720_g1_i8.p1 GENE.c21720_g1_i8~~c21720_g1_i8.p1  ORF type:complete len:124 (+),score=16.27 c21720_g1_i8:1-372(+)